MSRILRNTFIDGQKWFSLTDALAAEDYQPAGRGKNSNNYVRGRLPSHTWRMGMIAQPVPRAPHKTHLRPALVVNAEGRRLIAERAAAYRTRCEQIARRVVAERFDLAA